MRLTGVSLLIWFRQAQLFESSSDDDEPIDLTSSIYDDNALHQHEGKHDDSSDKGTCSESGDGTCTDSDNNLDFEDDELGDSATTPLRLSDSQDSYSQGFSSGDEQVFDLEQANTGPSLEDATGNAHHPDQPECVTFNGPDSLLNKQVARKFTGGKMNGWQYGYVSHVADKSELAKGFNCAIKFRKPRGQRWGYDHPRLMKLDKKENVTSDPDGKQPVGSWVLVAEATEPSTIG